MGVYIELPKEWAKWSFDVRDIHDNILEAKVTDLDLVRCGECKYQYMCGHQINRHGTTLKLTCCEYGERRADCEDETDEEWYDWRDEQEYEDRWERRADEHTD